MPANNEPHPGARSLAPAMEQQQPEPLVPARLEEGKDDAGAAVVTTTTATTMMTTATVHLGDVDATTTGGSGSSSSANKKKKDRVVGVEIRDEKKEDGDGDGDGDDGCAADNHEEKDYDDDEEEDGDNLLLLSTRAVAPPPAGGHFASATATTTQHSPSANANDDDGEEEMPLLFGTSPASEISIQPCLKDSCGVVHDLLLQLVSRDDPSGDGGAGRPPPRDASSSNGGGAGSGGAPRRRRRAGGGGFSRPHPSQPAAPSPSSSASSSPRDLISPTASSFESDTSSLAGYLADYVGADQEGAKTGRAADPTTRADKGRDKKGGGSKLSSTFLSGAKLVAGLGSSSNAPSSSTASSSPLPESPASKFLSPAVRMGHRDLVSLCSWTLEQVGGESPVLISPRSLAMTVAAADTADSTPHDYLNIDIVGRSSSAPNKPRKQVSATEGAPPAVSSGRTTMFASEYARRLSTSSSFSVVPASSAPAAAPGGAGSGKARLKPPRRSGGAASAMTSSGNIPLLHKADPQVRSGAVLDLVATVGEATPPPPGYYRVVPGIPLSITSGGATSGSGGASTVVYLNVKKEVNWDKAAQRPVLTSLAVLHAPADFVPPGFCIVKAYHTKMPAKLGNSHIVFKRSREGNPLTDVVLLEPPAPIPTGYTVVERTPRNLVATVGSGAFFVAYRQRLANLETLRPVPLIRAAQPKAGADFVDDDSSDDESFHPAAESSSRNGDGKELRPHHRKKKSPDPPLLAYYATGATTVASHVGRFHILDRSTHSLLSPSSVQHRLSLVQLSRTSSNDSIASQLAHALECDLDRNLDDEQPHVMENGGGGRNAPGGAATPSSVRDMTMLSHFFKMSLQEPSHAHIQACWDALSFIPTVETYGNAWLLQERMVVITPILTACYTRHGGASRLAVQALTKLLMHSDFFADDVYDGARSTPAIPNLTLLDLATQCVCDVATTSCCEVILADCVEFVQGAIDATQSNMSQRTLGYVLRFYLFVFYFGASTCTNCEWPNPKWRLSGGRPRAATGPQINEPPFDQCEEEVGILTDPRPPGSPGSYLPGGAPQAAALALKDFLHWVLLRLGKTCFLRQSVASPARDVPEQEEIGVFLGTIFNAVLETAVENVERANYTQLAYYQIHRSGGSELFWHDMITSCAPGLFRDDSDGIHAVVFAVLANLVKVALGKVRTDRNLLHSRDSASKLLSLELLLYFLEMYADEQEALESQKNQELVFSIRRMVVPCLLTNTRSSLEDPHVYLRILKIVSELWLSPIYRQRCKVEIGILIEHFALRVLQMRPQTKASTRLDLWSEGASTSLLSQQVAVLREVKLWCADPKDTIELFLNYDTDVCMTGPVQLVPGTRWKLFQRLCTSLTHIAEQCGEFIGQQIQKSRDLQHKTLDHGEAVRLLRTTSLETISQIVKSLAVAAAASCATSDKFSRLLASWNPGEPPYALSPSKSSKNGGEKQVLGFWRDVIAAEQQDRLSSVAPTQQESRQIALEIAKRKSLKKAIEYLIACNGLSPSPRDVANFLRLHKDELDPSSLGEYISETGVGPETEWWKAMRHSYVRAISFVGMKVEEGLRHFLTNCGFRLPGEGQRIDRIMSTFAKCYFEDNAGDLQRCPFKYEDTVYLVSFAIIMLNTDLHRSSVKHRKKMTKAEFVGNLRGAEHGEEIPKEYLSKVYDSIETSPIVLDTESSQDPSRANSDIQDMLSNVRSADTLLRGLAVHDFHFATVDDFGDGLDYNSEDALADLTRCCVAKTWHQWHGVINTGLEMAHLDPTGMGPSLDILLYALTLTVVLDMPTERAAFLSQVGRLKAFEERRQGRYVTAGQPDDSVGEWFRELEQGCCGSEHRKIHSLQCIHDWIVAFKADLLNDAHNKITMQAVVRQLRDRDDLLQDPARAFHRAGSLLKKSARTGRSINYRFYLFSDVLLYAKEESDGRFTVHEELPLHLLKVVDWFPPSQKNRKVMFEVSHPRKSFFVLCSSAKDRKSWVKDIKAAVQLEMDRMMKMEAARLAANQKD